MKRDDWFENETRKHQQEVAKRLIKFAAELLDRATKHDESKLHEPEYTKFAAATRKLKGLTYGSPEYKKQLKKLGVALDHHYENNKHHPEYNAYSGCLKLINGMDLVDLIEMLFDWEAATLRHDDGCIFRSIDQQQKKLDFDDTLKMLLTNTIHFFKNKNKGN